MTGAAALTHCAPLYRFRRDQARPRWLRPGHRDPQAVMPRAKTPESDETRQKALEQLDEQLDAFEAKRKTSVAPFGEHGGVNEGYRLVAGLIGGVLGGVGLGWFFDHLVHTSPIGLISGLLIGTVVSIVGAVTSASRMSARLTAQTGPVPPAQAPKALADEDDE